MAESVLIQHTRSDTLHFCGILYKHIVLFPASLILSTLPHLPEPVKTLQPGRLHPHNHLNITPKNTTLFLKNNQNVSTSPIRFLSLFSCNHIEQTKNIPISCWSHSREVNSLLSWFVIGTTSETVQFNLDFFRELINLSVPPQKADGVYIESTPFGNVELLGSVTKGIVSNLFGVDDCYFITDAPVGPGCEGAPVFQLHERRSNVRKLNGMVVSSINLVRGEHTGLTLAVSLVPLLSQIINENYTRLRLRLPFSNLKHISDHSLARLFCGRTNSGTAILIDKDNAIFLTASHVVRQSPEDPLRIQWKSEIFPAGLIFKSKINSAYDIALVQGIPNKIKNMEAIQFSDTPPKTGDNVYAVGYPLFYHRKKDNSSTITSGNVILCNSDVIYTNSSIINGASGGAILDSNGRLLGIIISHASQTSEDGDKKIIYTRFNMSIPISAVRKPILNYLKRKDLKELKALNCTEKDVVNKWNIFRSKL